MHQACVLIALFCQPILVVQKKKKKTPILKTTSTFTMHIQSPLELGGHSS